MHGNLCKHLGIDSSTDHPDLTLFASILNLSVMLGNYLQQTTSADDIFKFIFFLGALRVKAKKIFVSILAFRSS